MKEERKLPKAFYETIITLVQKSDKYILRKLQTNIPMNLYEKVLNTFVN